MVDKEIHNFYMYFTLFLVMIVILLGVGWFYLENKVDSVELDDIAVFETSMGNFKVKLYLEQSPITAGNFKKLVEERFYDRTRFHRVIKDFMIQGGDPHSRDEASQLKWGTGNAGYVIEDEFIEGLSNVRGSVSMANSGPNSGSSQFFINVKDNTFLDWDKQPESSKHPVFGEIVEGMEIIDEISKVTTEPDFNRPLESIIVYKAYMEKAE